jgi:transposase
MVVSAGHVPGEIGNRVKTDRRDGLKLARTLEAGLLRPIFVPEARQRADRELVRQRHRVQRDRCAAMVRIKSFFLTYDIEVPEEAGAHWSGDFEAWLRGLELADTLLNRVLEELRGLYFDLDARVDALTKELRQMARSPDYASMVELLSTVPGIGWLSALTLVVEIVDFGRFPDGEALSSYAGLTPSEHSSGERIRHGHISRQGNPVVRSVLVESSWILIGRDPESAASTTGSRSVAGASARSWPSLASSAIASSPSRTAASRIRSTSARPRRTKFQAGDRDSPRRRLPRGQS